MNRIQSNAAFNKWTPDGPQIESTLLISPIPCHSITVRFHGMDGNSLVQFHTARPVFSVYRPAAHRWRWPDLPAARFLFLIDSFRPIFFDLNFVGKDGRDVASVRPVRDISIHFELTAIRTSPPVAVKWPPHFHRPHRESNRSLVFNNPQDPECDGLP